ncbi:DUF6519 domain-containing protein [Scytonema sp. PCC 10023]|uniref:DUF6519 domain-containing protein n=1 Tax=Scytonema sp. PCC 10023 TaxID=1680591 RepID=UPI0039C6F0A8
MGNFSRNTFDPAKGYVGVRLQQGVPLVDADWNELNDVTRHELYTALSQLFPDGVAGREGLEGLSFFVFPGQGIPEQPTADNDFYVLPGRAIVGGRPFYFPPLTGGGGLEAIFLYIIQNSIRYSAQPWTDPTRAAEDGVDVIPPLTTPVANRTDLVYVDLWDREVDSTEDPNLVNTVIGVETCVRLKRQVTIRVAEGTTTLPAAPSGHVFMAVALLNRPAGQAALTGPAVIQDIRPVSNGLRGTREISFTPAFFPFTFFGTSPNWLFFVFPGATGDPSGFSYAFKSASETAGGVVPLMLPQGARLLTLNFRGYTRRSVASSAGSPGVSIWLLRSNSSQSLFATDGTSIPNMETLLQEAITHTRTDTENSRFNRSFTIPSDRRQNIADSEHYYSLLAFSSNSDFEASIQGISIRYEY